MEMKRLPKIELHCHLDGSVRPETLMELAEKEKLNLDYKGMDEFKKLIEVPDDCESLDEYLKRFDIANEVMQNEENLSRITYELMEDVYNDNVKYIEIRFAPSLHLKKGLDIKRVIQSVIDGMKRAEEKFDIHGNLILSCMRTMDVQSAFDVVREGAEFLGKGVVAVDLASSEDDKFVEKFEEPIKLARELGYRVTIHAGETGIGENVLKSIEILHAERIGHGVYSKDCPKAYELLKTKGVTLEMCPTSNVQTKAVKSYKSHPIKDYMDDGIKVSINTDNMTVSNTTLNKEFKIVQRENGVTDEDLKRVYMNSVEASFASEEIKNKLKKLI